MADKTITIPEPSASTNGLTIHLIREAGVWRIDADYRREGVQYSIERALLDADFTLAQRTSIQSAITAIVAVGKPLMRRADGGDGTGF